MQICNDGHEDIVHDEYHCPLCAALTYAAGDKEFAEEKENQYEELAEAYKELRESCQLLCPEALL